MSKQGSTRVLWRFWAAVLAGVSMTAAACPALSSDTKSNKLAPNTKSTEEPQPTINYDDPNMAMSNDYVGDAASSCIRQVAQSTGLESCLRKAGLAHPDEIEQALLIVRSTSPHRGIATEPAVPIPKQRPRHRN